ncbi:hypothetical protein LCGC14_1603280 [marine sediment metagenome]|uniref:Uncharacterized protein n=1 Tax=marine sediment metagenome TaxID=412755 RepID=A0A0F9IX30_9ZZZZ
MKLPYFKLIEFILFGKLRNHEVEIMVRKRNAE